jgi:pimeloyl-ACP methyl ester carboxylesterase
LSEILSHVLHFDTTICAIAKRSAQGRCSALRSFFVGGGATRCQSALCRKSLRPDDFGTTLAIMKVTIFILALLALTGLNAQDETQHGIVQRIKVHGKGLEGNLEGDSPDRDVAVYLPPSYNRAGNRRYPVVYLLHGFTDDVDKWWRAKPHFVKVPKVADKVLAAGVKEMILVMPNAFTRYQGSLYSNSVTTGDWEDYVAKELVDYVDSHYRTIADPSGRGLAGHSMGGYGTIRIGMKHPGVYSSLYLLSPCCMMVGSIHPNPRVEAIHYPADVATLDFLSRAVFASAAAWSPNPKNPPFFLDLPYKNGEVQPRIVAKWRRWR